MTAISERKAFRERSAKKRINGCKNNEKQFLSRNLEKQLKRSKVHHRKGNDG